MRTGGAHGCKPPPYFQHDSLLAILRSDTTQQVNTGYIIEAFGEGKNGVRDRAWLQFFSGHLDIKTLKAGKTSVEMTVSEVDVNTLPMKATLSMKNVVYSVYIVFSSSGYYIPKLSKCDCPDRWSLCSHTLVCFLLICVIQVEDDWSMHNIISFMPVPIKSLQIVPLLHHTFLVSSVPQSPERKRARQKILAMRMIQRKMKIQM